MRPTHEGHVHVDREIDTADFGLTRRSYVCEWDEFRLYEWDDTCRLVRDRLYVGRAVVTQEAFGQGSRIGTLQCLFPSLHGFNLAPFVVVRGLSSRKVITAFHEVSSRWHRAGVV